MSRRIDAFTDQPFVTEVTFRDPTPRGDHIPHHLTSEVLLDGKVIHSADLSRGFIVYGAEQQMTTVELAVLASDVEVPAGWTLDARPGYVEGLPVNSPAGELWELDDVSHEASALNVEVAPLVWVKIHAERVRFE